MTLNKYKSYKSHLIPRPKNMPKSKSWRCPAKGYIPLPPDIPHIKVKKLDTVFNIQTILLPIRYSFQVSHLVCFSFSRIGVFSLIN